MGSIMSVLAEKKSHAHTLAILAMENLRVDFPILQQTVNGNPLVYLDNAATTQKPQAVMDSIQSYYQRDNANVHRGVHTLSQRATLAYESVREKVRQFINAQHTHEIIFTSGATNAINLVANSYGQLAIKEGDEIILSVMEHHSNIVPWQLLCQRTGAILRVIPLNDQHELDLIAYADLFNSRTKLVAITHISNALGTINPIKSMIEMAHSHNALVLVDGAQAIPHMQIDVQDLDCDFYAFSGHKMYGPTGVGVLYGKTDLLEKMPPYQGGGEMISQVTFAKTTFNKLPHKFEAGTPNIADVIGLGAAIDYLQKIGLSAITEYEHGLLKYATKRLASIAELTIIGAKNNKAAVISFTLHDIHPHDIGTILDMEGIAIRAGHHCAMPLMDYFKLPATARASFSFYNTKNEIDVLVNGIEKIKRLFA
jgi:cysteine desulfurase/selenocysteine lyase